MSLNAPYRTLGKRLSNHAGLSRRSVVRSTLGYLPTLAFLGAGMSDITTGKNVLLVEDQVMNQELVIAILTAAGHHVDIACDGIEAITAVKTQPYDLILMDIRMPRMDGVTAARKIRELPDPQGNTPIIALTAHALHDQVREYWQAGMDDFVAKPFKAQDLHDTICRVLGLTEAWPKLATDLALGPTNKLGSALAPVEYRGAPH